MNSPEPLQRVSYLVPQYPQRSESFVHDEFTAVRRLLSATLVAVQRPTCGGVADPHVRYADEIRPSPRRFLQLWQTAAGRGGAYDRQQLGWRTAWSAVGRAVRIAELGSDPPPQLWHAHFAGMGQHAAAVAAVAGVPFTVMVHGTDLHYLPRYPLTDAALHTAAAVICASRYNAERVVHDFGVAGERVHCIPLGLDTAQFRPVREPRRDHVVAVGRLERVKGFDVLIEAVRMLARQGCVLTVDIVGEGTEQAALQQQIASHALTARVRLRGPLEHAALPAVLSEATVVVVPSRSEGFGLVAAEALACGTPVVASRVGGLPEIVTSDCGAVVDPEDPAALAHAIAPWLGHTARRAAVRTPTRRRAVTCYERERQIAALMAVWADCLASPRIARPPLALGSLPAQ